MLDVITSEELTWRVTRSDRAEEVQQVVDLWHGASGANFNINMLGFNPRSSG